MINIKFERTVLEAVAKVADIANAHFFNGTMFIECTPWDAAKIETALIEALKCGVIVSKVGPEYCYDFVGE